MPSSSSPHASVANAQSEPIVIIGAGIGGLIHAYVLLCDGFKNVTIITRDSSVGGVWEKDRIYPGLKLNNSRGEYRFSPLEIPPLQDANKHIPPGHIDDGRANGEEINVYFERFYKECLADRFGDTLTMRFETEVLKVRREGVGNWFVHCLDKTKGEEKILRFSKLILATGITSDPVIPSSLSPNAAKQSGYNGIVVHSNDYGKRYRDILASVSPANSKADPSKISSGEEDDEDDFVLVAGCGKSAKDVGMHLANEGRKVCMVFTNTTNFVAGSSPPPAWLGKSRFMSVLVPFSSLNSLLERFLHNTRLGSWLIHKFWDMLEAQSIKCAGLPPTHPFSPPGRIFYTTPTSTEGVIQAGSFYPHAREGRLLSAIRPARLVEFTQDTCGGSGVKLDNGRILKPTAVILCTGFHKAYTQLFDDELIHELGLEQRPFAPSAERKEEYRKRWYYHSLRNAPPFIAPVNGEDVMLTVHRGIVPVRSLPNRDFVIAGGLFASNLCYTTEVAAHWVSSYFLSDPFLSLPTPEKALQLAEEKAAWSRIRYPTMYRTLYGSGSPAPSLDRFSWPQITAELFADLGVGEQKNGTGIFWAFRQVGLEDLETLGEERKVLRQRYSVVS